MASSPVCNKYLRSALSGRSIHHALNVLSAATAATVTLFDVDGVVLAGPTAGNEFIRRMMDFPAGRQAVLKAHRAAFDRALHPERPSDGGILTMCGLEQITIPVIREGERIGLMSLGDRPSIRLSPAGIARIETALDMPAGTLSREPDALPPWSPAESSDARNMAALVGELFTELCRQDEVLRRRIEELSTVYNITGLLAGTRDIQETLDRIARMVCEVMNVKACSIRLLDEETGLLNIQAVHNLSPEYLNKGPVTVEQNPIDLAALEGEVVYVADAPNDDRTQYREQARKEGIVSGLVCGMIYRGEAVGVLRVYTGRPHHFSPAEQALLRAVASQAAAAIVNTRLLAEAIEAERVAQQLAYAGEVQRRMIPDAPPRLARAEIGAVYRPTFEVGGDFYDFIRLPDDNLGIAIADVSGKGVPASLVMASLRSALRVYANFTYDVDRIIQEVNRHLCCESPIGEFSTVFYGVLTPDGRRLTYCNAGHDPPLLLRRGTLHRLETGGMLVGVDPDAAFEREVLPLEPGDVILLYTDGAVDALNFNDESFGRVRLTESFLRHADQPAQRMAKNILWDIRRFRGYADRTDDVTLVTIKIR